MMIKVKLNKAVTIEGVDGEIVRFQSGTWYMVKPRWVMPAFIEPFRQVLWGAGLTLEDQNEDVVDFAQLKEDERWTVWTRAIYHLQQLR